MGRSEALATDTKVSLAAGRGLGPAMSTVAERISGLATIGGSVNKGVGA